MLSFCLLGLSSGHFPRGFSTKILRSFLVSFIQVARPPCRETPRHLDQSLYRYIKVFLCSFQSFPRFYFLRVRVTHRFPVVTSKMRPPMIVAWNKNLTYPVLRVGEKKIQPDNSAAFSRSVFQGRRTCFGVLRKERNVRYLITMRWGEHLNVRDEVT